MCLKSEYCEKLVTPNYVIQKRIKQLGIPTKYIAYYYLVDILDMLTDESVEIKSFSKEVYPMLAEKYNKKECTVERDIRHIINIYWQESLMEKLTGVDFTSKPSCLSFIVLIKNYIESEFQ